MSGNLAEEVSREVVNLKESLKQMRIMPTRWILEQVGRKLRGHYAYYGVSEQPPGLVRFYREQRSCCTSG